MQIVGRRLPDCQPNKRNVKDRWEIAQNVKMLWVLKQNYIFYIKKHKPILLEAETLLDAMADLENQGCRQP